jgi:hypothetical protein
MELKEFISESLSQISEAISDARKKTKVNDCIVNPYITEKFDNINQNSDYVGYAKGERLIQAVKFDIAVTVEKGQERKGEIKVAASAISAGIMGGKKKSENTVSRLYFTVPISLPIDYME